jgi:hypothetical protein
LYERRYLKILIMTYTDLKLLINDAYSVFASKYINKEVLGIDNEYSLGNLFFVKVIYKVLLNQDGDETTDSLTKVDIQNNIRLFDKFSNSTVPIEYS